MLRFGFNLPTKGVPIEEAVTRLKPLMSMVFYSIDKIKRYRLSKEGKGFRLTEKSYLDNQYHALQGK